MPNLTLSVTAAQWTRIKGCIGQFGMKEGEEPTSAGMSTWIKRQIKAVVRQNEDRKNSAAATFDVDLEAEGWNV